MTDCESDMSSYPYVPAASTNPSPHVMQVFFDKHKLISRESTFLFTISGDVDGLRKFSKDMDPYFSDNFRRACKSVLKDIHKVRVSAPGPARQYNHGVARLL